LTRLKVEFEVSALELEQVLEVFCQPAFQAKQTTLQEHD
jgi:hypothetical protein